MWQGPRAESPPAMVFRLHEGAPELVREVLLERGWEEFRGREQKAGDWNLYWRGSAFRKSDHANLLPWQRLNHHPKTVGITRKDCLARNLRRMKGTFGSALYDFSPTAFILPNDYTRFLAEYAKPQRARVGSPPCYWICKPVDLSRGRGIFIFEDIRELVYNSPIIVQRYISDPMLISGYKFDLRIYACVQSFHPLTIYMYQEGLVRFATEKYSLSTLGNIYAHLTNTSINKCGPFYSVDKERVGPGCKWTMSKFRHFLHNQGVNELPLWQKINNIVTLTLLTIAPMAPSSPNCVELLGFDILIDSKFKPWLLEVNYSPALTLDCPVDARVKKELIGDLIDLMDYRPIDGLRERVHQRQRNKRPCCLKARLQTRSAQAPCPTVSGVLSVPELTDCDYAETETPVEGEVSSETPELHLGSWKGTPATGADPSRLPDIHSRRRRLLELPRDGTRTRDQERTPPPRVGNFILTFPFNEATLKASRNQLDVKTAVQEVQKLMGQLGSLGASQSEMERRQRRRVEGSGNETIFETFFWGPKELLLLNERFLME